MNASPHRRVGILGGMGPAATVDFYAKLVEETPARRDQEHLPVVVWADPGVPDRSAHLLAGGPDPRPWLRRGIRALVAAECDLLAVPCNTAHAFLRELLGGEPIELVDMIEVTADHLAGLGSSTVGILSTTGTLRSRLYVNALARRSIAAVELPEAEQAEVMTVIAAVKAGAVQRRHRETLIAAVGRLAERGADTVVAGCTELLLALDTDEVDLRVVDPSRILAHRVVEIASDNTVNPGTEA